MTATKHCTKCGELYPVIDKHFSRNSKTRDGFQSWCRKCCRQRKAVYQGTDVGLNNHRECAKRYRLTVRGFLQRVFSNMKYRCTNPNYKWYYNYGGGGIKVLFESSEKFIDYVVNELKVNPIGLCIHRIDNDGHYAPGNICFVNRQWHDAVHVEERI